MFPTDEARTDSPRPRVTVLCGGLSAERDVSLRSGRRVAEALRHLDFPVRVTDMDAHFIPELLADPPDCVVPVLHGAAGEDGALRDLLVALGIAFVGSGPQASRLAFDKAVAKTLVDRAGGRVAPGVALPHQAFRELGANAVLDAITAHMDMPLVVKPSRGGSALGTSVVADAKELPQAMVAAFAYGDVALMESFIDGTEVAVTVVEEGDQITALPAVEIVPDSGIYDYHARYTAGTTQFFCPARLPQDTAGAVADLALLVHRTLGLRDYSRIDIIVDASGVPHFLEANVSPGLTETSLLPQALAAADTDLGHMMATQVRQVLGRKA